MPNFENYESVNHGKLGKAFLPYEETETYVANSGRVKTMRDSITMLQDLTRSGRPGATPDSLAIYTQRLESLTARTTALQDSLNSRKMAYEPQQLYRLTHSYKMKSQPGKPKVIEDAYYFDTAFTRIIKVTKVDN